VGRDRILIVDDEAAVRFGVADFLRTEGYEVGEAASLAAAQEAFALAPPDLAVVDHGLPDGDALQLLAWLREAQLAVPVVILTGHGSIDLAVRSIKEGAEQFLTKPVELPALAVVLARVLANQRARRREAAGRARSGRRAVSPFVGASPAIRRLAELARRVAASDSTVLIQGETGSGKGVLAGWIHAQSPRAEEAFVDLNCSGLARELVESELFGHVRGAFTGASAHKVGLFEVAHRGTAFLDEIGDLDPAVQPNLLKVLEERRFRRLGDVRDRQVDVRLVSATHQDLARLVAERRFRSDLYYRISAIPLTVPPLRSRAEDLPLLTASILERLGGEQGRGELRLTPAAQAALAAYSWPGNIRELGNVLERAVLLSDRATIGREDLRFDLQAPSPLDAGAPRTLRELERLAIEQALAEAGGRVARAAARLGVPRSSLYQKIKKYRIPLSRD
jgi:DNA-binding NtrC family response regulator